MKPFITIYLDRVYRLRLTFGVIFEYEQLNKQPISSGLDEADMICLLWIMMRQEAPALKLEDMIALTPKDETVFKSLQEAINESFKKSGKDAEPEFFDIESTVKLAADIGISFDKLYNMTPLEFDIASEAFIKRRKKERNDLYTLAWYSAYFRRVREFPDLGKYLEDVNKPPKREMTDDEMLNACKLICAANGGEIVEI